MFGSLGKKAVLLNNPFSGLFSLANLGNSRGKRKADAPTVSISVDSGVGCALIPFPRLPRACQQE